MKIETILNAYDRARDRLRPFEGKRYDEIDPKYLRQHNAFRSKIIAMYADKAQRVDLTANLAVKYIMEYMRLMGEVDRLTQKMRASGDERL